MHRVQCLDQDCCSSQSGGVRSPEHPDCWVLTLNPFVLLICNQDSFQMSTDLKYCRISLMSLVTTALCKMRSGYTSHRHEQELGHGNQT